MCKQFFHHCLFAVMGLAIAASVVHGQEYKIKLTRPDKVGDEYVITVSASSNQTIDATVNGQAQPQKTDGFKAQLHGTVKVLAVNEKSGGASKITCTIDKLTKDGAEMYHAGTIIAAEKVGLKSAFTIDGAVIEGENVQVLDILLSVDSSDRTTNDDQLTGSDQPQKVGDTWPINADKVAKEVTDGGLPVSGSDLKGQSKLVEVKKINDTEIMVIETGVTSDNFKKDMPDGSSIADGMLDAKLTFELPTDGISPIIKGSNTVHVTMNVNLPGGVGNAKVVSDRDVKQERERIKQ